MNRSMRIVGCLAVTVLSAAVAVAQTRATTADLAGVVYDQSHAVLPGATVVATNTQTNQMRQAQADAAGRFTIPALPPGVYRVKAELSGFRSNTREEVELRLGTEVALEFTLAIAGSTEQVTVAAGAPVIDTQQTAVSTVITQQQINSLPINGRNFISFSVIAPGVTQDNTPQQGASATSGLTFSGQRARSNNITVDGLDNNDIVVGSVRATFSQEAVREFQVVTNSFSAEFGKASGGVVNIVTKSGTNVVGGNAFVFFRDDALNSKSHFERFTPAGEPVDREKAPYSQKQFGGIVGGPIAKDKTFFFGSFERLDVNTNNFVTIDEVTAGVLRRAGFPIDTGNVPYAITSDQFLFKVEHQINPNEQLVFRYNYADGLNENVEPWGGLVAKSRGAALDSKDHMFSAAQTAVFRSKIVNEARFQFAHRDQKVNSLDPNCGGECVAEDQGGPTVEILGVASAGRQRFTPQPRRNARYELLDTVSLFRRNHELKGGLDFNYVDHKVQALPLHFGGRYLFQALPAVPALGLPAPITGVQALALGLPAAYIQGYGRSAASYGYHDLSLFAQDDWRATSNVTVRLGVRYQKQFWPDAAYSTPGVSGTYSFPSDGNNVAPRLAASWDPIGDRKTSVHAAYGLYYDNVITAVAGITNVINGSSSGLRTLVTRFPSTIAAWSAPGHKLPEASAGAFPSLVIAVDPGMKTPYAHHMSAGVDRELPNGIGVAVNYVHARGFDHLSTIDYNPVIPALGVQRRPLDVAGRPGTSASVLQYTSFGETWYNGLSLSVTKRFTNHWQFLASYTLSKAEDNSTDFQSAFLPQDSGQGRDPANASGLPIGFNPDGERGPSLQDQRHRCVLSGLYAAPYGINISSIITVASGRPYNILAGFDFNGDGDGGTIPGPDRARANAADQSSSVGRNRGTLPTQATVDLRVNKRIPVGRRQSIDAIFEVFNLANRANFTDVNNIFGIGSYPSSPSPTFGQFQQAAPPRQMQLAVKINF